MRVEIPIHALGLEGQGVGFDSERNIYFVPGSFPGDRVRVETSSEKRYRDASLLDVLEPSADRRAPECEYFTECGGCDWLNYNYEAQLKAKDSLISHILERAELLPLSRLPIIGAKHELGYRGRVQLRRRGKHLGFFRRNSNDIVPIERCQIAHPKLNEEIEMIRSEPATSPSQKIELELLADGRVRRTYDSVHGASGFSQVNPEQNEVLRSVVGQLVKAVEPSYLVELFCGDGNLTFTFADKVKERLIGVDNNPNAIAKAQAQAVGISGPEIQFQCSPVEKKLARSLRGAFSTSYDTLLLDPPRSGMGKPLEAFVVESLRHLIYVSCSPVTFSQDVRFLRDEGFVLRSLQPIDMFPNTRHIELVAHFLRS